jgi:AcrR family transcriptional regulator
MMKNMKQNTSMTIGRRRSKKSHEAILKAALTLLNEKGYGAVTIEGIAARAGVGKQTIYRWWPSKAAVILEAFTACAESRVMSTNQGDLQTDLANFLGTVFETLTRETGPILRALMSEALLDSEFAGALREIFIARRRQVLLEILQRGVTRGEVRTQMDFELIIDMIYGPMWYRLLNQHGPLDKAFADQLTNAIVKCLTTPD